ncbi:MAG: msrR [Marmoricola sp.]|nr:msrR [Marmoricola sp.]
MTQDEPDEPDGVPETPETASPSGVAEELGEAPAQVELINDDDLSWVDRPEETEERRERREVRKENHRKKARRKLRRKRTLAISGVVLAIFLVLGTTWFFWTFGDLGRMPKVAGQAGLNTPGTTILLVGSNPSEPDAVSPPGVGWQHDFAHSDMVLLLHLTRDNRTMFVISIPRDSIVPIPGVGPGKLTDAFARGGAALYVRTIETMTGVRLDRVATMDMNSLSEITDDIGGVTVNVPDSACGVPAGAYRLDGQQALDYVTLQPCLPSKDLDRVLRQQSLLKAIMRGAVDGGKLANPFTINKILRATASHLTLEKGYGYPSMFWTLWSMRHLRSTNTTFLTIPVAANPTVSVNGINEVLLDPTKDAVLWTALRQDRLTDYLALNGADVSVLP